MQVVLYCFDCLYLDGDVMMRRPLCIRPSFSLSHTLPLCHAGGPLLL